MINNIKYIINIMVVKKKRTYKKQKGGLVLLEELTRYFDFIEFIITSYYNCNETRQNEILLVKDGLFNNINSWFFSYNNILIRNLIKKLYDIFSSISSDSSNYITQYKNFISNIFRCLLFDIFPNENENFFIKKLLKRLIQLMFVNYLSERTNNKNQFTQKINELFHRFNINQELLSRQYLMNLIKDIFLNEYKVWYGVPVFYGNYFFDNYQYNQFICEKVGVSSKDKRNYIINPVGALAWMYIDKSNNTYTDELYNLLRKILRFNYVEGINKRQSTFQGLPNLIHLSGPEPSSFCIRKNQSDKEEIIQPWTLRKCSITYGCSLKMTAEIRQENIASDEHILELLSILLKKELDKPVPVNTQIYSLQQFNRRRNGSALSPIQEFDRRLESDEMDEIQGRQREMNNRARYFRNFSLYNNLSPEQLLETKDYKTILKKLYNEARKLINKNTPYNRTDIQKRTKLLEIIRLLQINPQTRLNINHNLVRNL